MDSIWHDVVTLGVPIAEKVLRTVVVYVFLIAGLRLFGKRELGQLNPLDFIVLLLLSNTVQNAIIGNDNSLLGGLLGAGVLFVINDLLVRFAYGNRRARRLIEGRAEEVVRDGRVLHAALRRNLITLEELEAAARKQGIEHLKDVQCAHLEVSGAISFTMKEPTETEQQHAAVMSRLDAIEKRLAALATVAVLLVGALAGGAVATGAQAPPSTDVWVVPMRQSGTAITFSEPVNATHRAGYDNQPAFTADGRSVLYTSVGSDAQADIWRFALPAGRPQRVTRTTESEYSATPTPDGRSFSVIRVEADSTQRLWKFPLRGDGAPALVLERVKPVGYHVWAGEHTLVLFVLGTPSTLQVADTRTGESRVVARNIGRALSRVPGRSAVTFLQQAGDSLPWISELDVRTNDIHRVAQPPRGADYHVWTPAGVLLAASGSSVYRWTGSSWEIAADFGRWGVHGMSRLAVSPRGDWLAFVADDAAAP